MRPCRAGPGRWAILLAATALAFAPTAGGTLLLPSGALAPDRYQRWAESLVPAPSGLVTLHLDGSSPCPTRAGCAAPPATIWLSPYATRADFLHELGHVFDYGMPEWVRIRFLAVTRDPRTWRSPPNSPHERFAEAYGLCARYRSFRDFPVDSWGYGWHPGPRLHRRVCRLIRRAAPDTIAKVVKPLLLDFSRAGSAGS